MSRRPRGSDLLAAAAESFRRRLLPELGGEARWLGLLIAHAMESAGREMEAGEPLVRDALSRLAALYGEPGPGGGSAGESEARLRALSRRLAAELRGGALEDREGRLPEAVRRHLVETTVARLRITNPRHLEREGVG